jgi:predicted regulator of Ras-like GTPase activity (Roadblock/LC7/MglB family)
MEGILRDLQGVVGVHGAYVCGADGRLAGADGMERYSADALRLVGRSLEKTFEGLKLSRRKKVTDLDFLYDTGRVVAKNLGNGCLVIVCTPGVNYPLLNLTANIAARKLAGLLEEGSAAERAPVLQAPALALAAPAAASQPALAGRLRAFAVEFLGEDGGRMFDRELGRAGLAANASWQQLAAWLPQFGQVLSNHPDWRRAHQMIDMMAVTLDEFEG